MNAGGQLSPEHRQYLLDHAITEERITLSGAYSRGTQLVFPWRDGENVTEQYKDNPERKGPYIWEKGEPLHFWVHTDAGPESPVVVVEGTKQSLAVASWISASWSVYGMAGCEGAARINLRRFAGRDVVICLDADAGENLNVYEAGQALADRLRDRGSNVGFMQLNARGSLGVDDVLARDWDPDERNQYLGRKLMEATEKPAPRKPTARKQRSSDTVSAPPDTKGRVGVAVNQDRGEVIEKITNALVDRAGGTSLFNYGKAITKVHGSSTRPLSDGDFMKMLTEHVACYHYKAPTNTQPAVFDPGWPDKQTVLAIMSESSAEAFPELHRVVRTPFLREDGTICTTEGYDPATLTVLVTEGLEVKEVKDSPSPEGVKAAVSFIMDEWLGDFSFETTADRANVLAAVLTPFIRGLVPLSPLCVVSGSGPGVGKNLLADNLSVLVTGETALPLPYVDDEDETRKQLTATFRTGAEMFIFDEAHDISGKNLARALTGRTWTDRVLGASTMIEYPNKVTWMALGNQVMVQGDLYRRVYFVKLSGDDRSHDREGHEYRHPDLTAWALENRPTLVQAVMTLLRGWVAAGRPAYSRGATMGSFEAWDRMLSGLCAFAGYPEFLTDSKERRSESDLHGSYWTAHLEWLAAQFPHGPFTAAEAVRAAIVAGDAYEAPMGLDDPTEKGHARRLGRAYAQVQNRYFGGRKLIKAGMGHKSTIKWQIMPTGSGLEVTEVMPNLHTGRKKLEECECPVYETCVHASIGGREVSSHPSTTSSQPHGPNPFA